MPLSPDETDLVEAAAKGVVEGALAPVHEITIRVFGKLADQVGDILGDYGRHIRLQHLVKIMKKTQRILSKAGIETKVIPSRILLPAVHFASLEDDDSMQNKWAALLANTATDPDAIPPSFPDILHGLTPIEVQFLDRAYNEVLQDEEEARREQGKYKDGPPSLAFRTTARAVRAETLKSLTGVALGNVLRLGLLEPRAGSFDSRVSANESLMDLNAFARAFIQACRPSERPGE